MGQATHSSSIAVSTKLRVLKKCPLISHTVTPRAYIEMPRCLNGSLAGCTNG